MENKINDISNPLSVVIRTMEKRDLDDVVEVEKRCFTLVWSRQAFEDELKKIVPNLYFAAEAAGRVIGYAGVWHILGEGHITNVAVDPSFRNQKIGNQLLSKLLKESQQMGIEKFTLEVRTSNEHAIRLYKKFGFTESGIRKKYYADTGEDALIMWK